MITYPIALKALVTVAVIVVAPVTLRIKTIKA
jgi:hypothetical protein